MERIILLGSGGHARVLVDALQVQGRFVSGFVTDGKDPPLGPMRDLECIGGDANMLSLGPNGVLLVNGVGSVGGHPARRELFEKYRSAGFAFTSVVHPRAIVATDVIVEEGAQIMAGAIIQSGVCIGVNAIINTGAIVDHDSHVGDHAHIAPGACLAAGVVVGNSVHIGAGATVIQMKRIGRGAVVGAGAVVVSDVMEDTIVVGVPARIANEATKRR